MSYLNSAAGYVVPILLGILSTSVNADRVGPDGYRLIESTPVQHTNTRDQRFRPMSPPGYRPIQRYRPLHRPVMARSQSRPRPPARFARVAPRRWYPVQRVAPVLRGYQAYPRYGYRAPQAGPQYASNHRVWRGRRAPFDPVPNPYPMVRNRYRGYAPRYAGNTQNWGASRYPYEPQLMARRYAYTQRPVYHRTEYKPAYRRAPAYQPTQQMIYVRAPYESHYASRDMSRNPVPAGYQRLARR